MIGLGDLLFFGLGFLLEGEMSNPTVLTTKISEFSRLRQKGSKFEGKVDYVMKPCLTEQLEHELILAI